MENRRYLTLRQNWARSCRASRVACIGWQRKFKLACHPRGRRGGRCSTSTCQPREREDPGSTIRIRISRVALAAFLELRLRRRDHETGYPVSRLKKSHIFLAVFWVSVRSTLRQITPAPHPASPRKEAGRGDGSRSSPRMRPKCHLVGGCEGTTVRAPSPRLFAGRGAVRGRAISRPGSCDARFSTNSQTALKRCVDLIPGFADRVRGYDTCWVELAMTARITLSKNRIRVGSKFSRSGSLRHERALRPTSP